MKFVVLSSSRGTTFQAIIDAMHAGTLTATCLGLVTDRPDRGCIERAKKAELPVKIVEKKPGESKEDYDRRLNDTILELMTSDERPVIAAIGWMHILSAWFIEQWSNRILNVHPALLPKHGGEGMFGMRVHDAVLATGEKESGITIHLVDEGVDTGRIVVQKKCSVCAADTSEKLRDKVQTLEKEWYPKVLEMIEQGEIVLPQ